MRDSSITQPPRFANRSTLRVSYQSLSDEKTPIVERVYQFYQTYCAMNQYCYVSPVKIGTICGVSTEQVYQARKRLVAANRLISTPHLSTSGGCRHKYSLPALEQWEQSRIDELQRVFGALSFAQASPRESVLDYMSGDQTEIFAQISSEQSPESVDINDSWARCTEALAPIIALSKLADRIHAREVMDIALGMSTNKESAMGLINKYVTSGGFSNDELGSEIKSPKGLMRSKLARCKDAPALATVPVAAATPVSVAPETVQPVPTVSDAAKHSDRHAGMDTSKYLAEHNYRRANAAANAKVGA